ncbi:hypothetical protein KY349_04175 [Candidatus Woesearchaeota archaeon]|jgi:hypothetical protein|nr:hypothetical protein [Candidatus Woesearchaeota archaeon]
MPEQPAAPPGMPSAEAAPTELPEKAPEAPAKKPGLFAPKPKKAGVDINKAVSDLAGELNNIGRRLMVLEERYTNIRKKTQVTDQNMLNNNKKVMTEIQTTHEEMDELRKQITDIVDKMKIIVRELKECAKRQDVAVLQKYINIWEPVNFITREGATKMIKDQVEAQFKDLNIRLQQEDYIKEQIRLLLKDLKSG